ncbi:MAG: hypothetical protein KGI80_01420 [Verrucomicrobiota bacterium]|nr:hypothetical protein [Verrucomicrobiota bacterium]
MISFSPHARVASEIFVTPQPEQEAAVSSRLSLSSIVQACALPFACLRTTYASWKSRELENSLPLELIEARYILKKSKDPVDHLAAVMIAHFACLIPPKRPPSSLSSLLCKSDSSVATPTYDENLVITSLIPLLWEKLPVQTRYLLAGIEPLTFSNSQSAFESKNLQNFKNRYVIPAIQSDDANAYADLINRYQQVISETEHSSPTLMGKIYILYQDRHIYLESPTPDNLKHYQMSFENLSSDAHHLCSFTPHHPSADYALCILDRLWSDSSCLISLRE